MIGNEAANISPVVENPIRMFMGFVEFSTPNTSTAMRKIVGVTGYLPKIAFYKKTKGDLENY